MTAATGTRRLKHAQERYARLPTSRRLCPRGSALSDSDSTSGRSSRTAAPPLTRADPISPLRDFVSDRCAS